jgi:RimJ/RimL family protein N-acetyltransferase
VAGRKPSSPYAVSRRDVAAADLDAFFEHQSDPDAAHMAAVPARDRDAFVAHWAMILGNEVVTKKTVVVDGDVAGNVVSWEQDGKRLVGYWIGRAYWGRGVATSALSQFIGLLGMRPLFAHVATHHVASIRVLEKCGFTVCAEAHRVVDERGDVEELTLKLQA